MDRESAEVQAIDDNFGNPWGQTPYVFALQADLWGQTPSVFALQAEFGFEGFDPGEFGFIA